MPFDIGLDHWIRRPDWVAQGEASALRIELVSSDQRPFELTGDDHRLEVFWRSEWDEPIALAYAEELARFLRGLREGTDRAARPSLVVDATGLRRCNILARGCLADLQNATRSQLGRVAFIAGSPQMRGLCLWIVKIGEDTTARVFGNREGVEEWLAGTQTRLETVKQVARRSKDSRS